MTQNGRNASNHHNTPGQPQRLGLPTLRGTPGLLLAILAMSLVGWMYLSQASEGAETARRSRELRQQKEELQRQNDQLTYEIASLASVDRLAQRARELGYVDVWEARFLVVTGYPVEEETWPTEAASLAQRDPGASPTASAVVGWWQAITDQFEVWTLTEQP